MPTNNSVKYLHKMARVLLSLYFLLLKWFVIIKAEETNITFPIISNETDMKNFNKTSILRYGFHRTHKCLDFQKTYVCINTCLSNGYDIASADKDCKCTCFKDKIKSKYFTVNSAWKLPTTTIPAWAGGHLNLSKDKFVLVHTPNKKYDHLKKSINEAVTKVENSEYYDEDEVTTNEDGEDLSGKVTTNEDAENTTGEVTTNKDAGNSPGDVPTNEDAENSNTASAGNSSSEVPTNEDAGNSTGEFNLTSGTGGEEDENGAAEDAGEAEE